MPSIYSPVTPAVCPLPCHPSVLACYSSSLPSLPPTCLRLSFATYLPLCHRSADPPTCPNLFPAPCKVKSAHLLAGPLRHICRVCKPAWLRYMECSFPRKITNSRLSIYLYVLSSLRRACPLTKFLQVYQIDAPLGGVDSQFGSRLHPPGFGSAAISVRSLQSCLPTAAQHSYSLIPSHSTYNLTNTSTAYKISIDLLGA